MGLEELSVPHVPGDKVRLKLLRKGAEWQKQQIKGKFQYVLAKRKAAGTPYSQTISFDELFDLLEE